jgi:hypothetical protein
MQNDFESTDEGEAIPLLPVLIFGSGLCGMIAYAMIGSVDSDFRSPKPVTELPSRTPSAPSSNIAEPLAAATSPIY